MRYYVTLAGRTFEVELGPEGVTARRSAPSTPTWRRSPGPGYAAWCWTGNPTGSSPSATAAGSGTSTCEGTATAPRPWTSAPG